MPSIGRRDHFQHLRRSRVIGRGSKVRVTFSKVDLDEPRLAFAISKKVGGAVQRNRIRRRLRAICMELSSQFHPGAYLIGVSPGVLELSHLELKEDVQNALTKMKKLL